MSAALAPRDPGGAPAAALSLLVHVLLFLFLFFGVRWASKTPDAVIVELWDRPPAPAPVQVTPPPKVEPAPRPKPEPRPEPKPKVEPKQEKPDIALKKEKKPPPKKEEQEPRLKIDRDAAIREQLAREMAQVLEKRAQPAKPAPPASGPVVDASYANKIKAKIKSNIVLPPEIPGNPEAIFDVVQLPTGEVLSARLRKSSGHRGYDEAVERAILKSSPLPRPDRPEQFVRDLQLKFRPQE